MFQSDEEVLSNTPNKWSESDRKVKKQNLGNHFNQYRPPNSSSSGEYKHDLTPAQNFNCSQPNLECSSYGKTDPEYFEFKEKVFDEYISRRELNRKNEIYVYSYLMEKFQYYPRSNSEETNGDPRKLRRAIQHLTKMNQGDSNQRNDQSAQQGKHAFIKKNDKKQPKKF